MKFTWQSSEVIQNDKQPTAAFELQPSWLKWQEKLIMVTKAVISVTNLVSVSSSKVM